MPLGGGADFPGAMKSPLQSWLAPIQHLPERVDLILLRHIPVILFIRTYVAARACLSAPRDMSSEPVSEYQGESLSSLRFHSRSLSGHYQLLRFITLRGQLMKNVLID